MTPCPSSERLRDLLADRLHGADAADVEAHVEACAGCQQALEQLTRNPDDRVGPEPAPHDETGGDFLRRLERCRPDGPGPSPGPGGGAALAPHSPAPPLPSV